MKKRPLILGIESTSLSHKEKMLFEKYKPLGFILFKRNCETPNQVKQLVAELNQIIKDDCHILIDQEGGRVARLKQPDFKEFLAPSTFTTPQSAYDNALKMANQLKDLGITVNCTPLADLVFKSTHNVIGNRSFGADPKHIGEMAAAVIKGHFDAGITPVIKHLPGHGRAIVDSHEELPVVHEKLSILEQTDFKAFQETLKHLTKEQQQKLWGMTAHIVYSDLDPHNCATQSPLIVNDIVRHHIGFKGVLISDCITMKALSGSMIEKAKKCIQSGCDIALHCSGDYVEMNELLVGLS